MISNAAVLSVLFDGVVPGGTHIFSVVVGTSTSEGGIAFVLSFVPRPGPPQRPTAEFARHEPKNYSHKLLAHCITHFRCDIGSHMRRTSQKVVYTGMSE